VLVAIGRQLTELVGRRLADVADARES